MKAIIFDVDGTLIDSVDLHAKAWHDAFVHFGYHLSFSEIRSQIGKGGDQLLPFLLSPEEAKRKGDEIQKYRGDLFKQSYLSHVKPFPQVRQLFQRILAEGWKVALASSAKADELQIYKDIAQVSDLIDTETSSDDAEKSKPHPDIFLASWEKLAGVEKRDCIGVGDSPYDAQAARKAGMQALGVLAGGFPEDDLRKAGAQGVFQDPADLLQRFNDFKSFVFKHSQ